ncbi:unnamed protein product [Rotaria magnacalcarata]|uniref:LamG-like jellyroll fold domain-containing protein n=1 Tax=Rotaria magnacalcarata TaxID=392030 RepID=A0A815LBR9_9BILA|nr:unnamed protein product [Rotaria magnacalcarata]CAF3967644.1 unnamed protein product [Rotaria magnacalcarata]
MQFSNPISATQATKTEVTTTKTTTTTTSATTSTATTSTTTTTAQYVDHAFWSFDSNALELYNTGLDGILSGSPTYTTSFAGYGNAISLTQSSNQYVYIMPKAGLDGILSGSPTYTTSFAGYGNAISLTQSSNQYVYIMSKVLPLNSRSFTIEAWIYPIGFSSSSDYGIFGQCQTLSNNSCLYFLVRTNKLLCGFYNDDIPGSTTLNMSTWYHVACTYDATTMSQQVWIDGYLDGSRSANPYQGLWGNTTIGATFQSGSASSFNGYIDNVRFQASAKNSSEILSDATLHAYYSFDGGSLIDNGPNGINGTSYGNLSSTTGRVNEAMQFSSGPYMSYSYNPYYFLGISNHAFTMALWAKPTKNNTAETLIFVGSLSTGWCVHFLDMTSTGQIVANCWSGIGVTTNGPIVPMNIWTHIGYTYSINNGLRLYINGSQYSATSAFTFVASGVPMSIVLGGNRVVHKYM